MARLQCYHNYSKELCEKEIIETEYYGYKQSFLIPNKKLLIELPYACNTEAMFRKLKSYYGFAAILLPVSTELLWKAKNAGWSPDQLVIWPDNTVSMAELLRFDGNRIDIFGNDAPLFKAIYFDEPTTKQYLYICSLYKFVKNAPGSENSLNRPLAYEFIVGDYSDWGINYWKFAYPQCADKVMYTGYDAQFVSPSTPLIGSLGSTDQRSVWSEVHKVVGDNANYWIGLPYDLGELDDLFEKAKNLNASELWLFAAHFLEFIPRNLCKPNLPLSCNEQYCNILEQYLQDFCERALRHGWLERNERVIGSRTVYCQRSDCSECIHVPTSDTRYWGENPLAYSCPVSDEIDILPRKRIGTPAIPRNNIFIRPAGEEWFF